MNGVDEIQTFVVICELHRVKPEGNPYSLYLGSYSTAWMEIFDTNGWIKILDTTVRMNGSSFDFILTDLGQQILEFDKL